ncbi:MAG: hypothetical protein AAB535_02360 [Patescibacteria group bacterium]
MALGWRGQYLRYKEYFLNVVVLYKQRRDLKMFLEVILSLITITIFGLFALKPTALTIISLVKEVNEKEKTISLLDQKIANLDTASSLYSENSGVIPLVDLAVPNQPQPEIFVGQIQAVASKNAVQVLGVSVGEIILLGKDDQAKKKEAGLKPLSTGSKEMTVSISISGNYQGIISTARDLENLRRPIKIDAFGINTTTSESGNIIVAIISGRLPFIQ